MNYNPIPNASFTTNIKCRIKGDRHVELKYGFKPPEVTPVMIHIDGYGPRRVYRSRHTGKCFIRLGKRVRYLIDSQMEAIRSQLEKRAG